MSSIVIAFGLLPEWAAAQIHPNCYSLARSQEPSVPIEYDQLFPDNMTSGQLRMYEEF